MTLHYKDPRTWLHTVWNALHTYRDEFLPEGEERYDDEWSDITTAMAWITDALELNVMEEDQ